MPTSQSVPTGSGNITLQGFLVEAVQQFSSDIYRRTVDTSVWLKLVQQEAWPEGMGDTISVLTYERTLPGAPNMWNTISVSQSGSATGSFIPTATQVDVAQTIRTYGIQHTAIESNNILMHDALFSFRMQEQLKAVYDNLVENVSYLWQKRYRDEYRRLCGHKVIATRNNAGALWDTSGDDYPTTVDSTNFTAAATGVSTLTQGLLNVIYLQLIREGGGNKPMGRENGRPIFTLVCSPEASDALIRLNASTRDDYRYSPNNVNELLKPLGVERSYRGFYHLIDIQIPRYNYVVGAPTFTNLYVATWDNTSKQGTFIFTGAGTNLIVGQKFNYASSSSARGAVTKGTVLSIVSTTVTFMAESAVTGTDGAVGTWTTLARDFVTSMTEGFTEIPFYIPDLAHTSGAFLTGQGGASGKRWQVNPAYDTAQFEEAFIMHPEVMKSLIPRPLSSPGGNTKFDPISYRGDFRFLNIQDRFINPDGNYGYFRGVLASGSKPCRPEFGYAIMFQRQPIVGVYQLPATDMVTPANAYVESVGAPVTGNAQD